MIKLIATKPIKVYIDTPYFRGIEDAFKVRSKFDPNRMGNPCTTGFNYVIEEGETFSFESTNFYDVCRFKLNNDVGFIKEFGSLKDFMLYYEVKYVEIYA